MSSDASGFEVMMTGAGCPPTGGCISNGCVLVMLIVGAAEGAGFGKMVMRAVSFFGPRFSDGVSPRAGWTAALCVSIPGGFGSGWRSGELAAGVMVGGRRKMVGVSAVGSAAGIGVMVGGRRTGVTGVRVGRTIRVVSCFAMPGAEPPFSGRGGSAIRTVSFFGSAMNDQRAFMKIAQTSGRCHL